MSEQLHNQIVKAIQTQGPLPFDEFMTLALYAPELGYYCKSRTPLGEQGDFSTAPLFSKYFGFCLANQVRDICDALNWDQFNMIEFGPGNGALAHDLLSALSDSPKKPPSSYTLVEKSPALRQAQKECLAKLNTAIPIKWEYPLSLANQNTIIVANELLDAFPVKRFEMTESGIKELAVDLKYGALTEILVDPSPELVNHLQWTLKRLPGFSFPVGYRSEVNLHINSWLQSVHPKLNNAVLLFFDYGYPTTEYYHPDRTMGTLMCHYQHKSYDAPLKRVGEQDITAHVDFGHVAHAAIENSFSFIGFCPQSAFLLGNKLLEMPNVMEDKAQIQLLTHPDLMGESFKVLAIGKNVSPSLQGFSVIDHSHRLG